MYFLIPINNFSILVKIILSQAEETVERAEGKNPTSLLTYRLI